MVVGDVLGIASGSSPRVRGTDRLPGHTRQLDRFIPACAGNRQVDLVTDRAKPVHPRVCGEQWRPPFHCDLFHGSSPRVRGTDGGTDHDPFAIRFIPACAGNRQSQPGIWAALPVHPRVCGEQSAVRRKRLMRFGSSPRVRGTGHRCLSMPGPVRFIPACAGNSATPPSCPPRPAVHPRVCGEQEVSSGHAVGKTGSSPRVRGTVAAPIGHSMFVRFIPACAGNRTSLEPAAP